MEMKWHPIVNGDLSGIQQQETLLFTISDERQNENYVTTGWILDVDPRVLNSNETKKVKAWMELPEPYEPGRCDVCKHNEQWTDCFGDRWSKCKFSERMFTKGCPTEKEVD